MTTAENLATIQDALMKMSTLEMLLLEQIRQADLPEPEQQATIIPNRRYRFDFAYPDLLVAIEVDGGTWKRTSRGRSAGHAHPARITHDNEKRNLARLLGWRVFQFDTTAINSGQALDVIRQLLKP